jgi:Domain of unknown function (DUF4936)
MQRTLYVYYKLPEAEGPQWLPAIQAFCQVLSNRWPGLTVELMRRPEVGADGRVTWMEVYKHPSGVPEDLLAAIGPLAREHGLPFERATEIFVPLPGG